MLRFCLSLRLGFVLVTWYIVGDIFVLFYVVIFLIRKEE